MAAGLPLPTLLSQALVAFTIELDNEAEHRMPHRTTRHRSPDHRTGSWLVSSVMWSNCLQFVPEAGVSVRELEALARTPTNLHGMQRWGYITVSPDRIIRPTPAGRKAQEVWRPLFDTIEQRWRGRFGGASLDTLRRSLSSIDEKVSLDLPDCLPILGYGLFTKPANPKLPPQPSRGERVLSLLALLSRVLLAFALEFESESSLSLAIGANVLRVLTEDGVRVRDLPLLSGVSKEAISMALGILQKQLSAAVESDPSSPRVKVARLTPKGVLAQQSHAKRLSSVEECWRKRFGDKALEAVRESLERWNPDLFLGLEPYPDNWRAAVRTPTCLPHYPMILHRGGYPDGS